MKRSALFSSFVIFVLSSWLPGQTPPMAGTEKLVPETVHISLNGPWKLFYFPQGKYQISNPDQLKTQGLTSIEASVPGEVALDLSRKGELPADLFFAENLKKLKPYELYEWWYQRAFPTPVGIDRATAGTTVSCGGLPCRVLAERQETGRNCRRPGGTLF